MNKLTKEDLYDEVEDIISATDFIEKTEVPSCSSSSQGRVLTPAVRPRYHRYPTGIVRWSRLRCLGHPFLIPLQVCFGQSPPPETRDHVSYALTTTVHRPFAETLAATRASLAEQGFGVLTEIDIQATLKAKLDVDVLPQVILGACRPPLAHAALQVEPSVGLLLPCNVVVRTLDDDTTLVQALDPKVMVSLTENDALTSVADEAGERLSAALDALTHVPAGP
jgi:uncharacterized protein (DUF302 family)